LELGGIKEYCYDENSIGLCPGLAPASNQRTMRSLCRPSLAGVGRRIGRKRESLWVTIKRV